MVYTLVITKMIYLLAILVIIHHILSRRSTYPYIKENSSPLEYIQKLDNYYINNKPYTFFMVILYFCLAISPFILLSIVSLGMSTSIVDIELCVYLIFAIVLIVLNIIYYLRILNIIFYPHAVRLHIYLRVYPWYAKFADNHQQNTDSYGYGYLFKIIWEVMIFTGYMSFSRLKLLSLLRKELRAHRANERYKNRFLPPAFGEKLRYVAWPYFQNKYFKFFDKWFVNTILPYIYKMPYSCLFLFFIYDMYHLEIYVTPFAGLFFVITIFISKISYFLRIKDTEFDNMLTAYFYKNEIPYKEVRKNIFTEPYTLAIIVYDESEIYRLPRIFNAENVIGEQGKMILVKMGRIITYILDGFKSIHFYD